MKFCKSLIFFFSFILFAFIDVISYSQLVTDEGLIQAPNPYSYFPQPSYTISEGKKYNDASYYAHPDFGKMTFSAPYGKSVVEDISKRTPDERHYVDLNDPTFFYIEKSSLPINFFQDGYLRAIDPSLHLVSNGLYQSGAQPVPTVLDLAHKQSKMIINHDVFGFNNLTLKTVNFDNSIVFYDADWSNIQVGNFGAYITEIFPGVDMKLVYRQAGVKSEYIIKQNMNVKEIYFIDELELPSNWVLGVDDTDPLLSLFVQVINSETGETQIVFDPASTRDASGNREGWLNPYSINGNSIELKCDSSLINNSSLIYPLTVDPLIVAVGPIASAFGIRGSLVTPASCNHSITVTYPGGSTPWDVSATWSVFADFCARTWVLFGIYDPCFMEDGQIWLTSTCGGASPVGAPGIVWTCFGCNVQGTWAPTLPFASSGTQSLAQCFPASCANQNITFTIFDNRSYCTTLAPNDNCNWANSYCISLDQWSVTVQGRTVETLGNTVTGNGSMTLNDPDCIGTTVLDPTPLYGVSGYTYVWSTGPTTPTITVPVTPGVYTATVTDACGTSVIATFNIGCPLPIRLNYFEAQLENEIVNLEWETLSEMNSDYFVVQRADKSGNFIDLFKVEAYENSSKPILYKTTDDSPLNGLSYYRLKMVDMDGSIEYSDVQSILINPEKTLLYIIPNPSNGIFELVYESQSSGEALIEIYSAGGEIIKSENIQIKSGNQSISQDYRNLPKGVYILKFYTKEKVITEKLVVD